MRAPSKPKVRRAAGWVSVAVAAGDRLAFWGAAYQMNGAAHAIVGRRGRLMTVVLRPKRGRSTAGLAERFLAAYGDQRVRWAVERANLDLRAEVLRRSLVLADAGAGPGDADAGTLAPEQASEIARLLAEAQSAPRDPLGIATPWDERRRR